MSLRPVAARPYEPDRTPPHPGVRVRRPGRSAAGPNATTSTQVTSAAGGRRIVRAVVWWTRVSRTVGAALAAASDWTAQTVRPAGALAVLTATVGLLFGIAFGWVEWMVAGAVALALLAMCVPFLFGERSYEVDLVLAHERVVAGDGVTGEIIVRNEGQRTALPGRLDITVGPGLVEFGVPLLRPGHTVSQPLEIPAPRGGAS